MIEELSNLPNIPNNGILIIESSAGTGKTFSIILIYLKLLFNIDKKYLKKISIQEILILTFTESVKQEIYSRLFNTVIDLQKMYIGEKKPSQYFLKICNNYEKKKKIKYILKEFLSKKEKTSIYTIHEFFWFILNNYRFSCTGTIPNKIISNYNKIIYESVQDFWRQIMYTLPKNIVKILISYWKTPNILYKKIISILNINNIYLSNKIIKKTIIEYHLKIIKQITFFKKKWIKKSCLIIPYIKNIYINKRIYNNKNITRWINKINIWSKEITKNYQIPKILYYFCENKIKKSSKNLKIFFSFFKEVSFFLKNNMSLEKIFIQIAIKEIFKLTKKKKKNKDSLSFNDIIYLLYKQIKSPNSKIKKIIQEKYPVILIDEFQDLDDIQFKVFKKISFKSKKNTLVFFGDPKQTIYNFKGSSIFSYLKFKKKNQVWSNLKTNFRSSKKMIEGINFIFNIQKNPFILKNIQFKKSLHFSKNKDMNFLLNNIKQKPINFYTHSKKNINIKEYYILIANICAKTISQWIYLGYKKKAVFIFNLNKKKYVQPKDIAVLVKNKNEANFIKIELKKYGIKYIYSSEKKNIFNTYEAKEIYIILNSIINLNNIKKIQQVCLTKLLNQNIYDLEIFKKKGYFKIINKLQKYKEIWNKSGIFKTIQEIIKDYQENMHKDIYKKSNKINIEKLINIGEILEKKSFIIQTKFFLIKWFEEKIKKEQLSKDNIINNEEKKDHINIVTIYKAKGKEYPIVWIPFFSNPTKNNNITYFCRKTFKNKINYNNTTLFKEWSKEDNFSEEIRLFYVCITRSIFHSCIGINLVSCKEKIENKKENLKTYGNAINYLIKLKKKINYIDFQKKINSFKKKNLFEIIKKDNHKCFFLKKEDNFYANSHKKIIKLKKYKYEVISYSKILKNEKKKKENNILNICTKKIHKKEKLSPHNFPKGINYGLGLHDILKKISLYKKIYLNKISTKYIEKIKILKWRKTIKLWITTLLSKPLTSKNIILKKLKKNEYIKEFKFYIPIKKIISINKLQEIIKKFDYLSCVSKQIKFKKIMGLLTGIIDLIFIWNNKFYFIDYKSNWIGPDNSYYTINNIEKEIKNYRYDIQYHFYSLALHLYLKKNFKNYNYKTNFGGFLYIFLRAFDSTNNNNGIFFKKIPYISIKKLDNFFNGKTNGKKNNSKNTTIFKKNAK